MNNSPNKFGKHLSNLFFFDPSYCNVNHGSYGSPARSIVEKYRKYQEEMDFNSEKFIRFTLNDKINEARQVIADYINCDLEGVTIVENASDGINAIFKSMLMKGGKILMFDLAYITAKNCAKFLCDYSDVEIVEVVLDEVTINNDELILKKIEEKIQNCEGIKLANIDHISSVPAVLLPVEKIISLLKKYNIPVFVDGAHTVGQIPLNINSLKPDFYISNFHKWGYNPKSACFLYVAKEFRNVIHPNIISSNYGKGYVSEFAYTGSKDYSSYFTIKDSLDFRRIYGEEEIMNYIHTLSKTVGEKVASIWGTDLLITDESKLCAMVNVRIPCEDEEKIIQAVKTALFTYNTYIVAFKFNNGKFYARFSAQIYNEIDDYIYAAGVFLNILKFDEVVALK